jgi:hypothetical protein
MYALLQLIQHTTNIGRSDYWTGFEDVAARLPATGSHTSTGAHI